MVVANDGSCSGYASPVIVQSGNRKNPTLQQSVCGSPDKDGWLKSSASGTTAAYATRNQSDKQLKEKGKNR